MTNHNPAKEFRGQIKFGFLATDEACKEFGERNFVPVPVSDSYWLQGDGVNNMFSLSYSEEFETPVTGEQQGLQKLVDIASPTNQGFIVLTIEQYDDLKNEAKK